MMTYEIIMAGFGGQGILSAGMLLAHAAMLDGKQVSWLPSYGPEMRGGTANSSVVISDKPVDCPVLSSANVLIVMNRPSLDKFESWVVKDGMVIIDSSIVNRDIKRADIASYLIPATQIASDMGNTTFANIILLGKLVKEKNVVTVESFRKSLYEVLPERKHHMIPLEMEAFEIGMNYPSA
ncbi:MAG: 2-oxoacid:ferredoxin oxidoreductase subunit gamma [Clostridiaceae bacterium]|nr:2-oxoacid:ferredoxin oxidoreductase subunit gamma [Clostridiaceae bacterium]